jgi:hypothetical protein
MKSAYPGVVATITQRPFGNWSLKGTSKNRSYSSDATKLSANDSASFPFRFMDVHARAALDPHREQFFEVP